MSRTNTSVRLAERPTEGIVPGKTFRVETSPAPTEADLKDGEILAETLYLSLDPTMRRWLTDQRSYLPPVQIGATMRGAGVVRVLASKSPLAKTGDITTAYPGWTEIAILGNREFDSPADLPPVRRAADLLGVLGMTGLTAFFGMEKIGQPKAGELVVVSGAAGATGSVAGQIAKLAGAKVVGTAGSDEKCRWLVEELGFDVALNYKDPDFKKKFREATKDLIDVYWDNVGGEQLDLALGRAKKFARFVMCGGVSQYNESEFKGPKNIGMVYAMRIKMQGFIILDYAADFARGRREIAKWLEEGKIKNRDTIVKGGVRVAEQALVDLYAGKNTGKLIVEVKNPEDSARL